MSSVTEVGSASSRRPYGPAPVPFAAVGVLLAVQAGLIGTGHVFAGDLAAGVLVVLLVTVSPRSETGAHAGELDPAGSDRDDPAVPALRALALAALVPVLGLGLPLADGSTAAATIVVSIMLAGIYLATAPLVGVGRSIAVSRRHPRLELGMGLFGLMLGLIAHLAGMPRAWLPGTSAATAAIAVIALLMAAIVEELVFRCLVQLSLQRLARRSGLVAATALSTALYAGSGSASLVLVIAIAAASFGWVVDRTGSALGALTGHAGFAIGAAVIWPLLLGTPSVPQWRGPVAAVALLLWLGVTAIFALRPASARLGADD